MNVIGAGNAFVVECLIYNLQMSKKLLAILKKYVKIKKAV